MLLPVQWEPRWANVFAFRAQSIGSLTRGWDGPGSVAINRRLLFEAVRIVEKALIGARNAVAPYLVPGGDGSLQIEWHEKDGEFEYDLSVEGSRSIWIRDHRTGEQIEATMIGRMLSFLVGRPGWRRSATMMVMCPLRRTRLPQELLADRHFIRTIQSPSHVVRDASTGLYRISSKAFLPSSEDKTLSGDLEQLLLADGLHATSLKGATSRVVGSFALKIGQLRDQNLGVSHDPMWDNWYHGAITGITTKRHKENLRKNAIELIPIDQEEAAKLEAESIQRVATTDPVRE